MCMLELQNQAITSAFGRFAVNVMD